MNHQSGHPVAEAQTSTANDEVLVLERFLPYRLSVLTNTVSRAIAREYGQCFGLSIPQWRVMAVLARFPDLSANEVAERTAMDKVMVSRAVAGMVRDGRVQRQAASDDRRRSVLRLSDAGRAVYGEIVPLARRYEARLLAELSADERRALDTILDRLTATGRRFTR